MLLASYARHTLIPFLLCILSTNILVTGAQQNKNDQKERKFCPIVDWKIGTWTVRVSEKFVQRHVILERFKRKLSKYSNEQLVRVYKSVFDPNGKKLAAFDKQSWISAQMRDSLSDKSSVIGETEQETVTRLASKIPSFFVDLDNGSPIYDNLADDITRSKDNNDFDYDKLYEECMRAPWEKVDEVAMFALARSDINAEMVAAIPVATVETQATNTTSPNEQPSQLLAPNQTPSESPITTSVVVNNNNNSNDNDINGITGKSVELESSERFDQLDVPSPPSTTMTSVAAGGAKVKNSIPSKEKLLDLYRSKQLQRGLTQASGKTTRVKRPATSLESEAKLNAYVARLSDNFRSILARTAGVKTGGRLAEAKD